LRKSLYIFLFAFFIYFLISTVIPDISYVGKLGAFLGKTNLVLFGYLGYIFPILLMYLLYAFYKEKFDFDFSIKVLGGIFIFFAFLLIQYQIVNKGIIAKIFSNFLEKYIGVLGIWIFIFLLLVWSVFLIFEEKILNIFHGRNRKVSKEGKISEKMENNQLENKTDNEIEEIKIENGLLDDDWDDELSQNDKNDEIIQAVEKTPQTENKNETENLAEKEKNNNEKIIKDTGKTLQIQNLENEKNVQKVEVLEDTKKLLSQIETGKREAPKNWKFPPIEFLTRPKNEKKIVNEAEIDKKIKILLEKLRQFKIEGDVVRYYVGPVVTTFEFKPLPHIKVSKILALQDDLAMALKAQSIRIQAPIPGKDVVGIEIPNEKKQTIYLREILESEIFKKAKSPLTIALGKDIVGAPFVTDLKKLPHLLIAGTTGSGKSVGINAMILSLLYRNSPDELKFVMIDPKMLEFSIYNDIPHLLTPVITEPKKAIVALNAMVKEMERRYKLMAKAKVKNIEGYNQKSNEKLPYIVIIIDELADLMMTSGKDVEYSIARLAQMARASGIHLIVATQRPSVDVVTGLIKANLPSRISFKVGQKIDSKVILDQFGAESLLGRGDMLFTPPGITGLIRLHAPFTTEEEIEKIVEFLKSEREPSYDISFLNTLDEETQHLEEIEDLDELFNEAKEIILNEKRTSISYIQRRLNIGYNRAANIIEQMERMGILSKPNSKGQREILVEK
jgi:S-DNA-T family DNA segregation ATPase FtsK/SpoIIIE